MNVFFFDLRLWWICDRYKGMNKYNEKSVRLQWLHLFIVKMSGSHNYIESIYRSKCHQVSLLLAKSIWGQTVSLYTFKYRISYVYLREYPKKRHTFNFAQMECVYTCSTNVGKRWKHRCIKHIVKKIHVRLFKLSKKIISCAWQCGRNGLANQFELDIFWNLNWNFSLSISNSIGRPFCVESKC